MFIKRKCVVCGEEFLPKVHNQKTCSVKCREKYMVEYRREYYRKVDKDKRRRYRREYYRRNRDKVKEGQRKWYSENRKNRDRNIDDIFNAFQEYLEENYD